jgi:NAD(P)-dependent dehydrogenase (short-subunit alcohol dehydrogenase family)
MTRPVALVVASLAAAGAAAAQTTPSPPVPAGGPERPRVAVVTGSTDGLGREVARRLASAGFHVVVHGRNRERGEALVREIASAGVGTSEFHAADLASLAEVRRFADAVLAKHERIDLLVNNAGIWLNDDRRRISVDGHELHLAVNHLAGALLARLLLPALRRSDDARILNVASVAQRPIDFEDPMLEEGYSGGRAYAQSKLAQILFTIELAAELEGTSVAVHALHPATLMATSMVRDAGVPARTTVAEGADAVIHLVSAAGLPSGAYYDGLRPALPHAQARDPAARARLAELTARLIEPFR